MLNPKTQERELAYIVEIEQIEPIPGYDRVEYARVGGWWVIVRKDQFKVGDLAIYIEIDSKVPEEEPFLFLDKRGFKVKTLKMCKVISQGLLMHPEDFRWEYKENGQFAGDAPLIDTRDGEYLVKGDFVTKKLGITYADATDNVRKAPSVDKYKVMAQRQGKRFSKQPYKWLMKRKWGKRLLFIFFGKKNDNKKAFPTKFPYIKKSDEERCENMPYILKDKEPFIKTTKIDGTSTLFILERKFPHNEFYVCSRNVRQLSKDQETYHGTNVYWEVEDKYHIKNFLQDQLDQHKDWSYVAIQGETAGVGSDGAEIQGDPHHFNNLRFFGYNFIDSIKGRWNSVEARDLAAQYDIEWVPIVDENYILPDTMEEFKLSADGPCEAPFASGLREGYVYRAVSNPNLSFKNVSREYLLKH